MPTVDLLSIRDDVERTTSSQPALTEIRRVHNPSLAEFESYAKRSIPVILTGIMKDWPAWSWTAESLKELLPDVVIRTSRSGGIHGGIPVKTGPATLAEGEMLFADYVDHCFEPKAGHAGPLRYAANLELPSLPRGSLPPYFPESVYSRPRLWLGPAGATSKLHQDTADNLHAVFVGCKRFLLGEPHLADALYLENEDAFFGARISTIDAENPDPVRFPRVAGIRLLRCDIRPGEMLFLPAFWFHHVRNIEPSIAMNFFVKNQVPCAARGGGELITIDTYVRLLERLFRTGLLSEPSWSSANEKLSTIDASLRAGAIEPSQAGKSQMEVIMAYLREADLNAYNQRKSK